MLVALVKALGIFVVIMGTIYLVKPDAMKKALNFWMEGKRLYLAAILNILIAILLLLAASRCAIPWIVFVFGIVSLLKGVLIFVFGKKKTKSISDKLLAGPAGYTHKFALLALFFGTIIIFSA